MPYSIYPYTLLTNTDMTDSFLVIQVDVSSSEKDIYQDASILSSLVKVGLAYNCLMKMKMNNSIFSIL